MESPMVTRGSRLARGSWNTICRSLRAARNALTSAWAISRPISVTAPADRGRSRITARARVDLPEPLSPTTPRVSPRRMVKLTPSTARNGTGRLRNPRRTGNQTFRSSAATTTGASAATGAGDGRPPRPPSGRGRQSSRARV